MSTPPLVSIITPCYNGEKYLGAFLDSILGQNYPNIELIFVDDGSTDSTASIVAAYQDAFTQKGLKLIYLYQENLGQAAAINQGLPIFQGEYLMWVDSDDILLSENIPKKVAHLKAHPEHGFVQCLAEEVSWDDLDTPIKICGRQRPSGEDTLFQDLLNEHNVCFNPCVMMATREAILNAIPTRHIFESRQGQNWQIMLPLAYHYSCGYIEEVLCKIIDHEDSHSRMVRTPDQQIDRYMGFLELQQHTIQSIADMDDTTKDYWIRCATIRLQRKIWFEATLNNKNREAKNAADELQKYGHDLRDDKRLALKQKLYSTLPGRAAARIIRLIKRLMTGYQR